MLTGTQQEALLRLFFALVSGGLLGYERSSKRVDAGFRTHIIVCMSSCAIMITNIHSFLVFETGDPMRMPAQVISGVGFLGAGCILVTGQHRIKGVTTAAGVWASACLGLCIGAGDYIVSGFVLTLALLAMTVFRTVDDKLMTKTRYMRLYVELESVSAVTSLMKHMRGEGMKVHDIEFIDNRSGGTIAAVIAFRLNKPDSPENIIADFEKEKGVIYASDV